MVSHVLRIKGKPLGFASVAFTSIFCLSSQVWLSLYVSSIDSYWACVISHEYMCTEILPPVCSESLMSLTLSILSPQGRMQVTFNKSETFFLCQEKNSKIQNSIEPGHLLLFFFFITWRGLVNSRLRR